MSNTNACETMTRVELFLVKAMEGMSGLVYLPTDWSAKQMKMVAAETLDRRYQGDHVEVLTICSVGSEAFRAWISRRENWGVA